MSKITDYAALTSPASDDVLVIVDVDDTTMSADGTTKQITVADLGLGDESSGTVTSASVVSANGFAGTVASPTSTPAITLETTVTGLLKGNGTGVVAATSGTDFDAPGAAATAQSNAETFATNAVGTETTRAEAAEGTNATAIATETTRAETAEALALQKASNLSDLASASTARTNLGLGSAATQASSAFDTAGAATTAQSTAEGYADTFKLAKTNNLSDLANAGTARTNLGLGSAATQASSAFDTAGAATAAAAYFLRVFAV